MKRIFPLFLCFCMLMTSFTSVFADPASAEETYNSSGTVYDLEGEADTPALPDDDLILDEIIQTEEDDEEIYENNLFDAENAAQLSAAEYVSDEIIIKFKGPRDVPGKEKQLQKEIEKVEKIGFVEVLDVYVVKISDLDKNPNAVFNRLKNNKFIEYVEPNYFFKSQSAPNDPNISLQNADLSRINAQGGWNILNGSSSAVIAIIDTGVAMHPDLPPLRSGYSAVEGLSPTNDMDGHGTKVAGALGSVGNNRIGGAGVNWNASILPVKVDSAAGGITTANIAKGITWAADNGAKVISISLSSTADSITLRNAINYAYNKGCAIFAATGNEGKNTVPFPARYPNVIGVGSTANGTARYTTSNYGPGVDVVASWTFYTTFAGGGYGNAAGTSIATPQVAGLASLILGVNPKLTNDQIYDLIRDGAGGNGSYNEQTGYGCINIGKTLELALATVKPQLPPATPAPPSTPVAPPQLTPETPQEVRTPPVITLKGFTELTLEFGQAYTEMGYSAADCKGLDLTSAVKITNTVKPATAGLYTVTYEVSDSAGLTARATRTVTVNAKPPEPPKPQAPKITINGSNPIVLHLSSGTPYKEQMAKAIDYDGTDISSQVKVTGAVNRNVAGTYRLTYSITGKDGLTATAVRDVRIIAPTEQKDPRVKYGFSGQAKQGAVVTHTGVIAGASGFMDLSVTGIDKSMTIIAELVDTATKKAVVTDTFAAAGTKQYRIDNGRYELKVTLSKASGNSKYSIELLMPETAGTVTFAENEVPLSDLMNISPVGSNPIILHIGGTPYFEQGARAGDFLGNDLSDRVEVIGKPDTDVAGTYVITYRVANDMGLSAETTREVRILDPNDTTTILMPEVPLFELPYSDGYYSYTVVKGDSLWNIAKKQYGDPNRWYEIYDLNKGIIGNDPAVLRIGQVLRLKEL